MKKIWFINLIVIILTVGFFVSGFAREKPVYGGILRQIDANGPRVLGWLPEMGPGDEIAVLPAVERMMEYNNADKQIHPHLAEKVDVNRKKKTITFHIRKGVKFHDGSDLTAGVAAFWYKIYKDAKRLQFGPVVSSIEVVDTYTMVLHLTDFNNQFLDGLGWVPIYSKAAWDKAGNGDFEKSKVWARMNCIGTGPFKLVEYKRDSHIKWARNKNYWQKGKPYLDGIEVSYIPDPMTASAKMQVKEADMWYQPPVKDQAELVKKGLIRHSGFGLPRIIYINNKSPESKLKNKKLREAIEYALDKNAIAKALGFGFYTPLTMTAPPGEWGFDPKYKGRQYNPKKARKLLAEAGYPNGLTLKFTAMAVGTWPVELEAIAAYLRAVGINVDADLADPGRFFASMYGQGWQELALWLTGLDFNYLATFFRQFGPDPFANYASFRRPQKLANMCRKAYHAYDKAAQKRWAKKLVRLMADECLVIPVFLAPAAVITQPYVHTTFYQEMMVARKTYDEWMDKH